MDKLTVLETVGPCLTKIYKSDGTTDPYDDAASFHYKVVEVALHLGLGLGVGAEAQVVLDGQRAEHLAAFGRLADAAAHAHVGAELSLVLGGKWPRACVNPTVLEKSSLQRWQPFSMERGPGN